MENVRVIYPNDNGGVSILTPVPDCGLTLEEIIAVKLELSSRYINNRLYNFPIWSSLNNIIKEAVLKYALSACRSYADSASFLGMNQRELKTLIKKYNIKLDTEE